MHRIHNLKRNLEVASDLQRRYIQGKHATRHDTSAVDDLCVSCPGECGETKGGFRAPATNTFLEIRIRDIANSKHCLPKRSNWTHELGLPLITLQRNAMDHVDW